MPRMTLAALALTFISSGPLGAAEPARTTLKPFNVTVRVFDPARGAESGQDYVLPVDSPDAEHAASSTMANAVSFTRKTEGGAILPVAFRVVKVESR